MTKYRVTIAVNIYADPEGVGGMGNALYHSRTVELEAERFTDVAVTVDGMYDAIESVVRAHGNCD